MLITACSGAAVVGVACETRFHDRAEVAAGECIVCHRSDYELSREPPHLPSFPVTCGDCHEQTHWSPARDFDHSQHFPLVEAHTHVTCVGCHTTGFEPGDTPTDCVGCHLDDYEGALEPSHDGYPLDCASCHSQTAFRPSTFDHDWPLRNAHARTACSNCHVGDPPRYQGTPRECVACHREDYERAINPSHEGFSTDCAGCHDDSSWRGGTLEEHSWPLLGAHASAMCSSCHLGDPPIYLGTPTTCIGCHAEDKRGVVDPPHDGFSDDCGSCHGNDAWQPAAFDHPWPLQGQHATANCASCHGDPAVYAGTPTACVGCHREDYDSSPFPGHDAFSTDCAGCHTTAGWTPASGGHPEAAFPIASGKHAYQCNDCHNPALGPNGRDNADCVGCHEGVHSRSRMDAEHREESGYPTGAAPPNFCLDCHPRGR